MKVYLNQYYDLLPFSGIDRGVGGRRRGGGGKGELDWSGIEKQNFVIFIGD